MPRASNVDRVNVLGVGVSVINLESAREIIAEAIRRRTKGYVCVRDVHGVMRAQDDPDLRAILNEAFLCTPDGMPMVWIGRLYGYKGMGRVYGPDLMLELCRLPGCRHFLYGGSKGTVQTLKKAIEARFLDTHIVGTYEPPWRPLNAEEETNLIRQVAHSRPDLLWVGLSTPKQERFMAEYLPKLDVTVMVGVGAAFDFHSGRVKQAPRWMQRSGLEWFYRLWQEPDRLGGRYLWNIPRFIFAVACQLLRIKRYSLN